MSALQALLKRRAAGVEFVSATDAAQVVGTSSNFNVTLPAGILSSDYVLVAVGSATLNDQNAIINTAGYTEIGDYYQQSSDAFQGANLALFGKFMTATPDTQVNVQGLSLSAETIVVVSVFRNVNPTTPLDISVVTQGTDTVSGLASSAITPATDGAMAVFAGLGASFYDGGAVNASLSPASGWTMADSRQRDESSRVGGLGVMYRTWGSGDGTISSGSLSGVYTSGTSRCSMRATFALRPA